MSRQAYDPLTDTLTPIAGSGSSGDDTLSIIATEETSVAVHAYVAGQQFVYTGKLYTATSAIAVNDTIAPGTNCTLSATIVSQLAAKQPKVLASAITIGGQQATQVEQALNLLNENSSAADNYRGWKSDFDQLPASEQAKYNTMDFFEQGSAVDSADNIVTFTSDDNDATTDKTNAGFTSVATMASGEQHKSLFAKISKMFLNIRKLWNTVGTTAIPSDYGATLTDVINNFKTTYNTYSTSETWTGKYWTDGKKIYTKTVSGLKSPSASNTDTFQSLGISNVDIAFLEKMYLTFHVSANNRDVFVSNVYWPDSMSCGAILSKDSSNDLSLQMRMKGTEWGNCDVTVVVEYTKTT